ncbi:MAG: hypothetical protein BWY98_00584 [Tenericutes bacterium ADurb.BinA155]|jgi:hypothetical protein|nr:MAG: hypothetical protein BWY98_00584 [Tenericutes bacterium ADurb.BinA155]
MKQKVSEKPFFHISTFAMLFFLIADACVAFSLKIDGVSRWSMYGIFAGIFVLGFIFALIAKKTGKSIFWAFSAAIYSSYFAAFSMMFGTIGTAINGVAGDPNAVTTGLIVGVVSWLAVILMFVAVLTRKKGILITSAIVQIGLSIFYVVEFIVSATTTFGMGRIEWLIQIGVLFEQIAAALLILATVTLHVCEFIQIDTNLVDMNEVVEEAETHANDFDPNATYTYHN